MLNGSLVKLVPLVREFRIKLFHWRNDRELHQQAGEYRPIAEISHDQWLDAMSKRTDAVALVIVEQAGGKPIGYATLADIAPVHRSARAFVLIGERDRQRQGFGTDALGCLVRLAFEDLDLQRVWAELPADNAAGLRMLERCGFQAEAVLRARYAAGGLRRDGRLMALLRST